METYIIRVQGVEYEVEVERKSSDSAPQVKNINAGSQSKPEAPKPATKGGEEVKSGVAGKVWKIVAKAGDTLKAGDSIVVLEAMKMEIPVVAPKDGVLTDIVCQEGQAVEAGDLIAVMA